MYYIHERVMHCVRLYFLINVALFFLCKGGWIRCVCVYISASVNCVSGERTPLFF